MTRFALILRCSDWAPSSNFEERNCEITAPHMEPSLDDHEGRIAHIGSGRVGRGVPQHPRRADRIQARFHRPGIGAVVD